ncbi:hypothetical protein FOA43_002832 [Brettanomyces nanus]|uniref:Uncharacterized protein n=1 Tax=Eeniella nana TaxID=13502 RepID=A0A875RVE7_EENNA|nr:uncharacterized protein FOA43_002832 [Brettanomyces nanus]QPG75477.1 hypothetical protein FOA43_002832 [Brettanomyces nanus]
MQIWDTAGQERFHNLTPLYYRNANLALVVFDLSDQLSFKKAEYWINELKEYMNDEDEGIKMKIILVGNKLDLLERTHDDEFKECDFIDQVDKFLDAHDIVDKWFKTSAKLNIGISELFNYVIDHLDGGLFHSYEEDKKGVIDLKKRSGGKGCC